MPLRSLILTGGLSSRMGVPKHTLTLPPSAEGQGVEQPLLVSLLLHHHKFQLTLENTTSTICISTRDDHQKAEVQQLLDLHVLPKGMELHFVQDELIDSGPAAGLLAAYVYDSTVSWLVSGCDYPCLSVAAFRQLYVSHEVHAATVTCFVNSKGFAEPLLAIWTSDALEFLGDMVSAARREGRNLGPTQVIRVLQQRPLITGHVLPGHRTNVNLLKPLDASCLTNVNTPAEWQKFSASPNADICH